MNNTLFEYFQNFHSIKELNEAVSTASFDVAQEFFTKEFSYINTLNTYDNWVDWAIKYCKENHPSPFKDHTKYQVELIAHKDSFIISLPGFIFGIRPHIYNNNCTYVASFRFESADPGLDQLQANGWKTIGRFD